MTGWLKAIAAAAFTALVAYAGIHAGILPGSAAKAERRLAMNAQEALAANGFGWAAVTQDGQKSILEGDAPNNAEHSAAISAVKKSTWAGGVFVGGVTAVDASRAHYAQTPPMVDAFVWNAEYEDGLLTISGYAPSETARELMRNAARRSFPGARIDETISLASGGPLEHTWIVAVSTSLHALARLESGSVQSIGSSFRLKGATDDAIRAEVLENLMAALPSGFSGAADLEITAAPDEANAETGSATQQKTAINDRAGACRDRLASAVKNQPVNFESTRTVIEPTSQRFLNVLSAALRDCPAFEIEISGHSDASGNAEDNQKLSRNRADAVAAYLTARGVSLRRISTIGLGSALPIVSNETAFGRSQNRRIEFVISFNPASGADGITEQE